MSRCGCSSSAASGAAISNTSCITATGAGTPASPFLLRPQIDANPANQLICGGGGLFVPNPDNPGNWSTYTPGWYTDTPDQPTIGNGILAGMYRKRGHSLELLINLVIGSTTYGGTGNWQWGLPLGLVSGFNCVVAGIAYSATTVTLAPITALAPTGSNRIGEAVVAGGVILGSAPGFIAGSVVYLGGTIYTTT